MRNTVNWAGKDHFWLGQPEQEQAALETIHDTWTI